MQDGSRDTSRYDPRNSPSGLPNKSRLRPGRKRPVYPSSVAVAIVMRLNRVWRRAFEAEARPKTSGERFGDPGGPDPGEATSSGASASRMRERAAQPLNPEMGRMGAEAPPAAFRSRL